MEFAAQHGYKQLRHLLLPRTKGLHLLANGMKEFGEFILLLFLSIGFRLSQKDVKDVDC